MKKSSNLALIFTALVVVSALYRVIPGRPSGFAPQIAIALFAGSVIKDKKLSFLLPLGSMFLSDLLYQVLFKLGLTELAGFYDGQWINYILFTGITTLGWFIKERNVIQIAIGALAGPVLYFLASNAITWAFGGGWHHPRTFDGFMLCMTDGVPFFRNSLYATIVFSGLFFGSYAWWRSTRRASAHVN